MKHPVLALALCIPLAACNQPAATNNTAAPAADTAAAADAVKAAEADLLAAFKAKDAQKVIGHYAADAEIVVPGEAVRSAAQAAKDLGDPAFAIDFVNTRTDVAGGGDMAYTRGTFTVTYTDPGTRKPTSVSGNYVTVFKKFGDGSWKIVQDFSTPGPAKS